MSWYGALVLYASLTALAGLAAVCRFVSGSSVSHGDPEYGGTFEDVPMAERPVFTWRGTLLLVGWPLLAASLPALFVRWLYRENRRRLAARQPEEPGPKGGPYR